MATGWTRIRFDCDDRDAHRLGEAMEGLGAIAVTTADAGDRPIHEPPPGATPLWPRVVITALFEDSHDAATLERAVAKLVPDPPLVDRLEERDWIEESRRDVEPIVLGNLWLGPTWLHPPAGMDVVRLDPGLAFGTGRHPTTLLCLGRLAELDLAGRQVVDYGCGSGILSLVAAARGAAHVLAVDNDPQAVTATASNAAFNDFDTVIETVEPAGSPVEACADVVVANILADPLVQLVDTFAALARPGAELSVSGILVEQAGWIREAYAPHFACSAGAEQDGWIRIDGRRR